LFCSVGDFLVVVIVVNFCHDVSFFVFDFFSAKSFGRGGVFMAKQA